MNDSAAASSSAVLTPGRTLACIRASVLTRMAPAPAIWSISAGLFLTIMPFPRGAGSRASADVLGDLVLGLGAVELVQQAALVVELDQGRGLLVVDLEPPLDLLGLVVVALAERLAVVVADALALGRVEVDVVDVPVRADPPARDPLDDLLVG